MFIPPTLIPPPPGATAEQQQAYEDRRQAHRKSMDDAARAIFALCITFSLIALLAAIYAYVFHPSFRPPINAMCAAGLVFAAVYQTLKRWV